MQVLRTELLERGRELEELRSSLSDARAGRGRLIVVTGEPGIGKTALLRAAAAQADSDGVRVLAARGTELERDFPFGLVRQLFEPVLVAADSDQREELLAGLARPAGTVVGVGAAEAPVESDDVLRDPLFATLTALFWLTSNLSESQPALLTVDDAHWGDEASLRFLRFLLPRLEDLPVLLVVAARGAEPGTRAGPLAEMITDAAALVLSPRALGAESVAAIVRDVLATDAQDEFCSTCHGVTKGNPFMLRELLVELSAEGSSGAASDSQRVRGVAPAALRRAALRRLGRLPADARSLARAVAVLGDDADPRLAAGVAGIDVALAAGLVDALSAADLIESERPLRYRHPLLRNAIYADIPPMERAVSHGRAAALLGALGSEPERIAVHLLATEPSGDDEAVLALSAAAQRALDRAAPEAAARYLTRAIAEPAPPGARPALVRQLITAAVRVGDTSLVDDAGADPLAELGADPDTLLASAWQLSMWLLGSGRLPEAQPLLDRAASLASERGDGELALRLEAFLVSLARMSPAQARGRFERHAAAIGPGTSAERLWLALQGWWGTFLGDSASDTADMARRAVAGGRIFAEQPDYSAALGQVILALARTEQLELAQTSIECLAGRARSSGSSVTLDVAARLRSYLEYLRGQVSRAEAHARRPVEAALRGGYADAVPFFVASWVDVLVERGDPGAADEALAVAGWTGHVPDDYWWTPVRLSRARLRLAQRRFADAAQDLVAIERTNARDGITHPVYGLLSLLALALAGQGRAAEARRCAAEELERARAWGTPSAIGSALRVVGLLASGDERLALLKDAVRVLEPSPMRLEYVRALAAYGAALRRGGQRVQAREPLREALELARDGGCLAIARLAHDELGATGETIGPLLATGAGSLTASERRVAALAAEGLSNREIAQSLFLTVKTVEMHLTRGYRKLGIGSRRQLGDVLERE